MAKIDKINQFKASTTTESAKPADNGVSMANATPPPAIAAKEASGVSGFSKDSHQGPGKITYANSGIVPTMTSSSEYTNGALRQMNESQFEANKEQMNVSDKEFWRQQFEQHPESAYSLANMMFASDETPFEKKKRERREELGQIFSNLGNVIGNAANLYYTSKGAPYIDLNVHQKAENDRIQKIRDRRQALKEKTDMLIYNAGLRDMDAARQGKLAADQLAAAKAKAEQDRVRAEQDRALDIYKFNENMAYKKGKDAADAKRKDEELAERKRLNSILARKYQPKSNQEGIDKEVAYVTKYGDVYFDNPKNKRAATLSTLQIMRKNADGDAKSKIDKIIEAAQNGNIDSYYDAEFYVSQHINDDAIAAKHMYELSKKYGGIIKDEGQRENIQRAIERGKQVKVAPYKRSGQNNNNTAPYLR